MSKIINGGLDQYSAGPFEQQQFGTAGVERVKSRRPVRVRPGTAAGYAIGCQILADFQHFCTVGKRMKFATKLT